MSTIVAIDGLEKSFGAKRLLETGALALSHGELIILTGDNGSGKTTLLKIMAGLERADRLALEFDGVRASAARYPDSLRREIVYVHQHPYLFNTSIADNLRYGLRLRAVPNDERERRVRDAIEWAGLGSLLAVPPRRLSGGEKQKVALARARVLRPRVLLVDEPTANLDAQARAQVIDLLRKTATGDNCVVVACHDRELIELPGAKRWHLEKGRVTADSRQ